MLEIQAHQRIFKKTSLQELEKIIDEKIEFELDPSTVDQVNRYVINMNTGTGQHTTDKIKAFIQLSQNENQVSVKVLMSPIKPLIIGLISGFAMSLVLWLVQTSNAAIIVGIFGFIAVSYSFLRPAIKRSEELVQELFGDLQ